MIFFSASSLYREFFYGNLKCLQLNTLAISIFHFDRGVFFLGSDGLSRLGWISLWSYRHSLGETFGVVSRTRLMNWPLDASSNGLGQDP